MLNKYVITFLNIDFSENMLYSTVEIFDLRSSLSHIRNKKQISFETAEMLQFVCFATIKDG